MLLEVLTTHSDAGASSPIILKIQNIRDFVEGQLKSIGNKQTGPQHARLVLANDEQERFLACCHQVQAYMDRLSLDTSLSLWRMEEKQSNDRMSSLLDRLPSSPSACYNSNTGAEQKRRECTPGTRMGVLASLHSWADGGSGGLYWINGMAGTGKTTIAYSICRELDAELKLAASFFCSRLREECRNVNLIIPSIAYQLARFSPGFQSALTGVLEKEPYIHTKRLDIQFRALIVDPLISAKMTVPEGLVVVIDALDECDNRDSTRDMLGVLLGEAADLPIKFIVSSRPEPHVRDQMTEERVKSRLVLHELDTGEVQTDIETYLREELKPIQPQLEEAQIGALVQRAGVLFIYAATVVRYVGYDNFQSDPVGRLSDILDAPQSPEDGCHEEIDQLYMAILDTALGNRRLRKVERENMRHVLYAVICAREPLTIPALSELLKIQHPDRVREALRPLWSVVHVVGSNELVTTLHASFPDFMFDRGRSNSYYCDSNTYNLKLAEHCFERIGRTRPQFNICGLESSYLADKDVPGIEDRIGRAIPSDLLYACQYWADHVEAGKYPSKFVEQMREFLSERLLLWLEVLNLNEQMRAGVECMRLTSKWCNELEGNRDLAELAHDARRFVDVFASNAISQSTPHIYVSMMAFWPRASPVAKHYAKFIEGPVEAEETALGRRQFTHLSTWKFDKPIGAMAMSPDGLSIALGVGEKVAVVDSSSGRKLLESPMGHRRTIKSIVFSPDGARVFAGSFGEDYIDRDASSDTGSHSAGYIDHGADSDTDTDADADSAANTGSDADVDVDSDINNSTDADADADADADTVNDATVSGWDPRSGDTIFGPLRLHGHTREILCLSFSPDCTRIVTGSQDKTVRLWEVETGKILHCLQAQGIIKAAVFSPDGAQVAAGSDKTLHVWETRTGNVALQPVTHTHGFGQLAFTPDGLRLISVNWNELDIYVWDAQTGEKKLGPIEEHTEYITCISCSLDGRYIVSGCADKVVCVWDVQTGNLVLGPLQAHTGYIESVAFTPDGSRIISACDDGLVCTWDAQRCSLTPASTNPPFDSITCVKLSSDGTRIISSSEDGSISIWVAQTGEMAVGPIDAHTGYINAVDFLNDRVVSGASDGMIHECDALTGEVVLGPLKLDVGEIEAIRYSPDGQMIATGSDARVDVWNGQNGNRLLGPLTGLRGPVSCVQFSPDGTRIVASSKESTSNMAVWDVSTGDNLFGPLNGHHDEVYSVSYSPNGALIASGSEDKTIILWDAYTGEKRLGPVIAHSDSVHSVHFSPDSARLVSGSYDRTIRVWDVETGEMMFELPSGHQDWITLVEYSPDGTHILSHSVEMSVRIHDARSPAERAQSRSESEFADWTMNQDGWVIDDQSRLLVWVPGDLRKALMWPRTQVIVASCGYVRLKFDKSRMGESWAEGYTLDM